MKESLDEKDSMDSAATSEGKKDLIFVRVC